MFSLIIFALLGITVIAAVGSMAAVFYFISMTDDERVKKFSALMTDPFSAHRELGALEEYCRGKGNLRLIGNSARMARLLTPPVYVLFAVAFIISIS